MSARLERTLTALADPTRRAVIQRLAHGPATSGQLADLCPRMSHPAVSQHLKVLREAGVVRTLPSGRNVWYELAASPLLEAAGWLGGLLDTWEGAPVARQLNRPDTRRQPA